MHFMEKKKSLNSFQSPLTSINKYLLYEQYSFSISFSISQSMVLSNKEYTFLTLKP